MNEEFSYQGFGHSLYTIKTVKDGYDYELVFTPSLAHTKKEAVKQYRDQQKMNKWLRGEHEIEAHRENDRRIFTHGPATLNNSKPLLWVSDHNRPA